MTRADDTRVVATGTVPLGALPPGDYVVRGIIRLEDGTTGTRGEDAEESGEVGLRYATATRLSSSRLLSR